MSDSKKKEPEDVISLGPELPGGEVPFIRTRLTEGGPLVEGGLAHLVGKNEACEEDVLKLRHLRDNHFEVEEVISGKGPAKVNSAAYRKNWDTIFGSKQPVGQA